MENQEKCSYECRCDCHKEGGHMVHMMPCCSVCPICGKNIKIGFMKEHVATHPDFVISEQLWKSLDEEEKWHTAFDVAKLTYLKTVLIVDDQAADCPIMFIEDFIKQSGSLSCDQLSGHIYLGSAFDEEVLCLEIKSPSKKLEMLFDEDGIILHSAIS